MIQADRPNNHSLENLLIGTNLPNNECLVHIELIYSVASRTNHLKINSFIISTLNSLIKQRLFSSNLVIVISDQANFRIHNHYYFVLTKFNNKISVLH